MRRAEAYQLWLLDKVRQGDVEVMEVIAGENVAESWAQHLNGELLRKRERASCHRHVSGGRELVQAKET